MYPTTTDRTTSISICVFQLQENPQRISLNYSIDRIVSIRVRGICWTVSPIDNTSSKLYLSCPELLTNATAQSVITMPGVSPSNQLINRRSLIAEWCVATAESFVPNTNNNDPQPTINLAKLTSVNQLTFILEDNMNDILRVTPLQSFNNVQVTLEIEQQMVISPSFTNFINTQ